MFFSSSCLHFANRKQRVFHFIWFFFLSSNKQLQVCSNKTVLPNLMVAIIIWQSCSLMLVFFFDGLWENCPLAAVCWRNSSTHKINSKMLLRNKQWMKVGVRVQRKWISQSIKWWKAVENGIYRNYFKMKNSKLKTKTTKLNFQKKKTNDLWMKWKQRWSDRIDLTWLDLNRLGSIQSFVNCFSCCGKINDHFRSKLVHYILFRTWIKRFSSLWKLWLTN